MIKINALGDACPIPVVKTKNAIKEIKESGKVCTLVDNEIAVQNLTKMARQKGYPVEAEKIADNEYKVIMTIEKDDTAGQPPEAGAKTSLDNVSAGGLVSVSAAEDATVCIPDRRKKTVVVISSDKMGQGSDDLGEALMKSFLFALGQQEDLPSTVLLYNGGAKMSIDDSPALPDLKSLEAEGVEILTCGTCLNHYGLTDRLAVGSVTNMYDIVEKLMEADHIIKP